MRFLAIIFAAVLMLGASPMLAACSTFPATQTQLAPAEAVIRGAMVVEAAYDTIGTQLDRGLITPAQGVEWKGHVDQAAEAVRVAGIAVRAGSGSAADLIRAMDVLLVELLRRQIAAQQGG